MKTWKQIIPAFAAVAALSLACGCKSTTTISYKQGTDFSRYHTFAVSVDQTSGPMSDTTAVRRLTGPARESVIATLTAKGFAEAGEANTDLLVKLHGEFTPAGSNENSTEETRRLTIEILDRKTGEVIWSRWRGGVSSATLRSEPVRRTIADMLQPFPPGGKTN